ncbi:hypothetical protein [Mesorhizobium sp. B2-8-9]|uniref:hypothetical protein n=1 Tax=Mesorhizobium sp. B2-8-9 TaxID=2589899 RepID=UPI001FEF1A4C|nr:hypothetical protein [Mesorhizobium sp. B2-8-9]
MKRSTERLLALAMLIVGIACFAKLYAALGGRPPATARLEVFGAAGVLSVLAGLLFLAGLLPAAEHPPAPLFGRDAGIAPAGHPRLRRAALALPLLALIVIVADQFGWRAPGAEPAKEVATAPADPAPRSPKPRPEPEASAKPNTPEASVEQAAPAPAQQEAAKPPVARAGCGSRSAGADSRSTGRVRAAAACPAGRAGPANPADGARSRNAAADGGAASTGASGPADRAGRPPRRRRLAGGVGRRPPDHERQHRPHDQALGYRGQAADPRPW